MDTLHIRRKRRAGKNGEVHYSNLVQLIINGVSLVELVKKYETPFAGKLAGKYRSFEYDYYTENLLLGKEGGYGELGNKTELLGCTCGCDGCWPLAIHIHTDDRHVFWEDFEQPHRDWDYSSFGPFVFIRSRYEREFRNLRPLDESTVNARGAIDTVKSAMPSPSIGTSSSCE